MQKKKKKKNKSNLRVAVQQLREWWEANILETTRVVESVEKYLMYRERFMEQEDDKSSSLEWLE